MTELAVRSEADVGHARREVQNQAREIGFDSNAVAELGIVIAELATNLVRHGAVDGQLAFGPIDGIDGAGVELVVEDQGPGIQNVEQAMIDRQSTINGSMGCGLGAVRRLMDEFDIHSQTASQNSEAHQTKHGPPGTLITARKYRQRATGDRRLSYGVATRCHPGESVNGDCSLVLPDDNGLLVAVADGLGHGPEAAVASHHAISLIRERQYDEFGSLLRSLHEKLRNTRGAALTLVRIDLRNGKLVHAGVGNVEARVHPCAPSGLLPKPGIVGSGALPNPRVRDIAWSEGATLVVFTDGILGRWSLKEVPELLTRSAAMVSRLLLRRFARMNDDATVVVAKTSR